MTDDPKPADLRAQRRVKRDADRAMRQLMGELALRAKPIDPAVLHPPRTPEELEAWRGTGYDPAVACSGAISAAELIEKYQLNGQDGLSAVMHMLERAYPTSVRYTELPDGSTRVVLSAAVFRVPCDESVDITGWVRPPLRDVVARAIGRGVITAEDAAKARIPNE